MSKWTELRDGALEALKEGAIEVGEETKQEFLNNFIESGIPVVAAYAAHFVTNVKKQAAEESGWCKIRDLLVIPFAVQIGLYVGKKILQMVQSQTATTQQPA